MNGQSFPPPKKLERTPRFPVVKSTTPGAELEIDERPDLVSVVLIAVVLVSLVLLGATMFEAFRLFDGYHSPDELPTLVARERLLHGRAMWLALYVVVAVAGLRKNQ